MKRLARHGKRVSVAPVGHDGSDHGSNAAFLFDLRLETSHEAVRTGFMPDIVVYQLGLYPNYSHMR